MDIGLQEAFFIVEIRPGLPENKPILLILKICPDAYFPLDIS